MILMANGAPNSAMIPSPITLFTVPSISVHRFHHVLDDRIEKFARLFRIAVGEQLHGAFHVGEQHRDLLALAFERAFEVRIFSARCLGV